MRDGPEAGLSLIDAILARGDLVDYRLAHAARADLLRRLGRNQEAQKAYERALALTQQEPERRFLEKRLREVTAGDPMKYLCLVYMEKDKWHAVHDGECKTFGDGLRKTGVLHAAEPLHPVETATTVRVRNGRVSVTDGPFAETKEQLAGFYLIEALDLNEAINMASKIPPAREGSIEVRPVRELQP